MPTPVDEYTKCKNDFVIELLKLKNESSNNLIYSLERYNDTKESINNAKL